MVDDEPLEELRIEKEQRVMLQIGRNDCCNPTDFLPRVNSGRPASVSSNGSSYRLYRLILVFSTGSSIFAASCTSVKWDEQDLETVREQRRKDRQFGCLCRFRDVRETYFQRSSEGRCRAPLNSIFPEVQHHRLGVALLNNVLQESHEIEGSPANPSDSDAASLISTNTTTSSTRARRQSYGAYPVSTIEETTSDGMETSKLKERRYFLGFGLAIHNALAQDERQFQCEEEQPVPPQFFPTRVTHPPLPLTEIFCSNPLPYQL